MTQITLKGTPIHTHGDLPAIGTAAPDFTLTKTDLSETTLKEYAGKKIILNIFPSLDTPTCALGVKHFNTTASQLPDTVVLCISADLPFAQKRFCATENIDNVTALSVFRHTDFGKNYGVAIIDGPLAGVLSRAVVIIDKNGTVVYTQQVPEVTHEVDYDDVMAAM